MGAGYLSKITVASMGLKTAQLEKVAQGSEGVTPVLNVYGFLSDMEAGESTFGTYTKFKGEIEGANLLTGELFRSGVLILPSIAETPLVNEMSSIDKGEKLKFALEIGVQENVSKKGGTRFKYAVKPLIEMSQDDELSKMRLALPDHTGDGKKKGKK